MSKSSEAVKNWRKNLKQRMLNALGGKCVVCDYDFYGALEFHHIDPLWENIVEELEKCCILCLNCHKEWHMGNIVLLEPIPKFDENYREYKQNFNSDETVKEKDVSNCPECGSFMSSRNKFCSARCSSKVHQRVDWDSIDLEKEIRTKSKSQIADELWISEAAVRKRLIRLRNQRGGLYDVS